jgi:hypothetical protein
VINPMMTDARKVPAMLPMPPITITAKAWITISRSMPRWAGCVGICSAPANPASMAPITNTPENSQR